MICHQCGRQEIESSAFCSGCGSAMSGAFASGFGPPQTSIADHAAVGRNCPYCRFPLKPGGGVTECGSCHAVHHADCWSENHGCAVMGCAAAPAEAPVPAALAGAGLGGVPAPPPYAGMAHEYTPPAPTAAFPAPSSSPPFANSAHTSSNASDGGSWYLKTAAIIGGVVLAIGGAGAAIVVASSSDSKTPEPTLDEAALEPASAADEPDAGPKEPAPGDDRSGPGPNGSSDVPDDPPDDSPSEPAPTTSPRAEIKAMLKRHFSDRQQGKLRRAFSDLTGAATKAGEARWTTEIRADELNDFSLKVDPSVNGDTGTATIVRFHTEAGKTGCKDWSGSWTVTRIGDRWHIAKSNVDWRRASCNG